MADITGRQAIRMRLDLAQERLDPSFATANRWEGGVLRTDAAPDLIVPDLAALARMARPA